MPGRRLRSVVIAASFIASMTATYAAPAMVGAQGGRAPVAPIGRAQAVADDGLIAFGERGGVFRINPDGTDFRQVWNDDTELTTWVQGLTWVPGTDYITYVHERDDETGRQLHNVRADGTGHTVWVRESDGVPLSGFTYVRAAPDGKTVITYMRGCLPDCEFEEGPAIFDISELSGPDIRDGFLWPFRDTSGELPDGNFIPLELYMSGVAPAFHPSGEPFAVAVAECTPNDSDSEPPHFCTLGDNALQTWDIDEQYPSPIVTESDMPALATHEIIAVDWAPGGSRMAFVLLDPSIGDGRTSDGTSSVWVVNADGSGLAQVTDPQPDFRFGTGVAWAPDGSRILFSGAGHVGLYTINPDGTGLATVQSNMVSEWFDWGPCPSTGCTSTPPEDSDGDGIVDASDNCPAVAEDADGTQDADGCPEDPSHNLGVTQFRVPAARAGSPPEQITIKIKNLGAHAESAYVHVSGTANYSGCSFQTAPIAPRATLTVTGCSVTYASRGTYTHTVTAYHGSTSPTDPAQYADNSLSDNTRSDATRAR